MNGSNYEAAMAAERRVYDQCLEVHDLPGIFHYWSNRYLKPQTEQFGFSNVPEFFTLFLAGRCVPGGLPQFVSLGAGNCDLEIDIAGRLRALGFEFRLDCVDLNPLMLERGRAAAEERGLGEWLRFTESDFNSWEPQRGYDAVIANQSLHHVVNLEGLFDAVKTALRPGGVFITSDMIGRNGHLRWPEALAIVHEFWRQLPPSYRVNQVLGRYEEWFHDWDCSGSGFEGIRAQDILPLLRERFHFHLFLPFGNLIDPFIDRSFGHYFDSARQWDRDFIDAVQERDEREISNGTIKPTHMFAVLGNEPVHAPALRGHLTPEFCTRAPEFCTRAPESRTRLAGGEEVDTTVSGSAYLWQGDGVSTGREIAILGARLTESERSAAARSRWALGLEQELRERTAWALQLDRERAPAADLARRAEEAEAELSGRTEWALGLDRELSLARAALKLAGEETNLHAERAHRLYEELVDRTAWALKLEQELGERNALALTLDQEVLRLRADIRGYIRNPVRYFRAVMNAVLRRFK